MKEFTIFIISLSVIIYVIVRMAMFCCVKFNINLPIKVIKYHAIIESGSLIIAFLLCFIYLFNW